MMESLPLIVILVIVSFTAYLAIKSNNNENI